MFAFISGQKTYILAGLGAILTFAHALDWIGTDVFTTLMGLIGAGTAAAIRAGIAKTQAKVEVTASTVSQQVAYVAADAAQAADASTAAAKTLAAEAPRIIQPDGGR